MQVLSLSATMQVKLAFPARAVGSVRKEGREQCIFCGRFFSLLRPFPARLYRESSPMCPRRDSRIPCVFESHKDKGRGSLLQVRTNVKTIWALPISLYHF